MAKKQELQANVDRQTGEVLKPYKHSRNAHSFPDPGETHNKPSLTRPDQTMSIKEILDRYAKGRPLTGAKVPLYHSEADEIMGFTPQEFAKMDISEREALMEAVADELVDLRNKLDAEARTKKEKEFLDKVDKEVRQRLKKIADDRQKGGIEDAEEVTD